MNKISIKLKVTIWYTLFMIIISAVVICIMQSLSMGILERDMTGRVIDVVNRISRIADRPHGDMGGIGRVPEFQFFNNGVHTAVYDSGGRVINGFIPYEFADEIELRDNDLKRKIYDGEKYLTYVKRVNTKTGETFWVKGVASFEVENRMLSNVMKTNLILTLILIVAASLGGYMIVRHSFKPVDKISKTAKEISESSDLSQRIGLGEGNDEIYRLAYTFDEMLDKIEKTLENEKQFTSDASHELRTPVAVINSECEYIMDCAKTLEEAKESVSSIKRQSDKMSALISELLTISRMDRNTQNINFEDADLSELVSFVCDEQAEIHEENITLVRNIQPEVHTKADRFLFTSLFINLISNAYTYGRENGTITVSLYESGENIVFSVADDGIGIAKEHIDKIWERFYQVDPSRSNKNGSMGLGLSMVKWIAQRHSGKITVESEPGKGSVFTLVIPKA